MKTKKAFEIVIVSDADGENSVKARLSQWPAKLYDEQELRALEDLPCLPDDLKHIASEARMAVIRQKSDRGYFSKGFKRSAAGGQQTGEQGAPMSAFGIGTYPEENGKDHETYFLKYCGERNEAARNEAAKASPYDHYEDYSQTLSRFHDEDARYEI